MNLEITFRHMEHTESIDEKIRQKLERLARKHLSDNATVKWTCLVEHDEHVASVHVTDKGRDIHVKAGSDSMYKTIDQVITKLEAQVQSQGLHPQH